MILHDTPYAQMHDVMAAEEGKVFFSMTKFQQRFDKAVMRSSDPLPIIMTDNYTVPASKNRYLIFGVATKNGKMIQCDYEFVLPVNGPDGKPFYLKNWDHKENDVPIEKGARNVLGMFIFTGHFFSRYRERAKIDQKYSTNEVIATFCKRNIECMKMLDVDKMVKKKDKYKDTVCFQSRDGIILGTQTWTTCKDGPLSVIIAKTFLSEAQLHDTQKKHAVTDFNKIEKAFRILNNSMPDRELLLEGIFKLMEKEKLKM